MTLARPLAMRTPADLPHRAASTSILQDASYASPPAAAPPLRHSRHRPHNAQGNMFTGSLPSPAKLPALRIAKFDHNQFSR